MGRGGRSKGKEGGDRNAVVSSSLFFLSLSRWTGYRAREDERLVLGELVVKLGIDRTLDLTGSLHELRAGSAGSYRPIPTPYTSVVSSRSLVYDR
jgi:hypothetical protein